MKRPIIAATLALVLWGTGATLAGHTTDLDPQVEAGLLQDDSSSTPEPEELQPRGESHTESVRNEHELLYGETPIVDLEEEALEPKACSGWKQP